MRAVALAATFLFATLSAARAQAPDPAVAQVQGFYDVLLDSMKHATELGVRGRYEKLKPAVEQAFDIPDMVRYAVGAEQWAAASPAEQQALANTFLRYTAASYANNFDGYSGEKFIVDPATTPRGMDKVVLSKLVTSKETITFGYRMHQVGGVWRILDVYLTGTISQLAIQRSEYAATLAVGGAPALIKKINALTEKLLAG
jgi:phospholipid transport system substrate-binding protein